MASLNPQTRKNIVTMTKAGWGVRDTAVACGEGERNAY